MTHDLTTITKTHRQDTGMTKLTRSSSVLLRQRGLVWLSMGLLTACNNPMPPSNFWSTTNHHKLLIDQSHPSNNHSERIHFVVIHYTAEDDNTSLRLLTQGKVSSHYLIMQSDKAVYQLVEDDKAAWHAGASQFAGRTRLNATSIGIEIVGQGIKPQYRDYVGYHPKSHFAPFQPKQISQLGVLLQHLSYKYNLNPTHIVGHSDIAPNRKIDPGAAFPWEHLYRAYGVGAWYDDHDKRHFFRALTASATQNEQGEKSEQGEKRKHREPNDSTNSTASVFERLSIQDMKAQFRRYGYAINDTPEWDNDSRNVVYAFQLHFNPEQATGELDVETYAILLALNHKYRQKS